MLSSVEEKIRVSLEEEVATYQAEIMCIQDTNKELLKRQEHLCQISNYLDKKVSSLSVHTSELQSCEKNLSQAITQIEKTMQVCTLFLLFVFIYIKYIFNYILT